MKSSLYTAEQIAFAMRQAESGTSVPEICRKIGISEQIYYRWKKKFVGMCIAKVSRLEINHSGSTESMRKKSLQYVAGDPRDMFPHVGVWKG